MSSLCGCILGKENALWDVSHSICTHLETVMLRGFFHVMTGSWDTSSSWSVLTLLIMCSGRVQWLVFNVFKVLQNFVLLLGKYSPPSSWTRPSWITGSGCMWEGSLPCCCRLWHEWIQSSVHGWFGAVPFSKLHYIRSLGVGGVVVVVSLTMENHGNQHMSWLTILFHRSAVYAMRRLSC